MDPARHVSDDLLEPHSLDRLSADELVAVEEHLLVYADCQDRLQRMDEFRAALRAAARKIAQDAPGEQG
jgi:anti-sigma factor RsiW